MPSDLSAYLAANYLTADPKPSKKRKRKHDTSSASGLLINDEDDSWARPSGPKAGGDNDEGFDIPVTAGTSAEFRKAKKSNWKTLGGGSAAATKDDDEAAAADAILASAQAEDAARRDAEDEAPVVDDAGGGAAVAKMSDGTHAGLQSAAAVSAQLRRRQREEREAYERERRERKAAGLPDTEEEAVYRDATGRRIDVSMRREAARRAAQEAEEKERAAKEALRGEVQVEEARRRRERLEDAALMPLARRADDEEINREMKAAARWNDPMAQFLSEKKDSGGGGGAVSAGGRQGGKKLKGRPVYKGPAQPNRYGIRPGYRWDGVDRGNGFEAERFKALNRRERNKGLDYAWQMDE